jgi:hypothetical protein
MSRIYVMSTRTVTFTLRSLEFKSCLDQRYLCIYLDLCLLRNRDQALNYEVFPSSVRMKRGQSQPGMTERGWSPHWNTSNAAFFLALSSWRTYTTHHTQALIITALTLQATGLSDMSVSTQKSALGYHPAGHSLNHRRRWVFEPHVGLHSIIKSRFVKHVYALWKPKYTDQFFSKFSCSFIIRKAVYLSWSVTW